MSILTIAYLFLPKKTRLGALESLRSANSRSIVVASDVAARGLDIPSVTTVIHYDVARVVDTFIHRAGRTAVGQELIWVLSCLCVKGEC
jgi:ATP-dependent RNA helicase DDX24/MAK5